MPATASVPAPGSAPDSVLRRRRAPAARPLPRPGPVWGRAPERAELTGGGGSITALTAPVAAMDGQKGLSAGVVRGLGILARLAPVAQCAGLGARLGAGGIAGGRRRQGLATARLAGAIAQGLRQAPDPATNAAAADAPRSPGVLALRRRLARDGLGPRTVVPALSLVARVLARTTGFEVSEAQLHCALILIDGAVAEMDTGEGKTCSAALAAAVLGLAGVPVHVLTANEYLAERDAQTMGPLFVALGLGLAVAREGDDSAVRARAYRARVVYTTARCVAFDHLRDRVHEADPRAALGLGVDADTLPGGRLLSGLCAAIVDEADSIFIDEASTPLVLSGLREDPGARARLWRALDLARSLRPDVDHSPDPAGGGGFTLTGPGRLQVTRAAAGWGGLWEHEAYREDLVDQALQALYGLVRDADYNVDDRQVVIVDRVSGRPAADRRWARELHGLVALKEGLPPPPASVTQASLTYPRLFARYHHLAGLSGTVRAARGELWSQYGLVVERVPRATPLVRVHGPMRVFNDREAQFAAAAARAAALSAAGRAVLLTVDSVADAEAMAAQCAGRQLAVTVLSARQDEAEAQVIAAAGRSGAVTVATQMAGRGTDIVIDDRVRECGGLHVINLQLNRSARVDQQIAGRAGRRGDPGSYEHWIRLAGGPLAGISGHPGLLGRADDSPADRPSGRSGPLSARGRPLVWLARIMLGGWQTWCALDDRSRRTRLVHADRHWARALHFARIRE